MVTKVSGTRPTSAEAIQAATGRSYDEWFVLLDEAGMERLNALKALLEG
jgi:cell division septal protein FtsQ